MMQRTWPPSDFVGKNVTGGEKDYRHVNCENFDSECPLPANNHPMIQVQIHQGPLIGYSASLAIQGQTLTLVILPKADSSEPPPKTPPSSPTNPTNEKD